MAKLTQVIPRQRFEIILDQIALFLADELANQVVLDPTLIELAGTLFIERWKPMNQSERFMFNVLFSGGRYEMKTVKDQDGTYMYFIDCYSTGQGEVDKRGDTVSSTYLNRMLGAVRAILESPHYKTLGFAPGFINHTMVTEIQIDDATDNKSAENIQRGRVVFVVRAEETTELQEGVPLVLNDTKVKIALTEEGYNYVQPEP